MSKFRIRLKAVRVLLIGMVVMSGCGQKSVEMGPVETIEAFCKAICSGQWSEAELLCDTLSIKEYIESQKQGWARFEKEDEGAAKVARSVMESTTVTINGMSKDDDKRIITYTLETDGLSKTNKATLKKVEGAWRVEAITKAD